VEAALENGCHYIDSAGEQPWLLRAKAEYGEQFHAAGRVLAPSTAALYTTADIAVNLARELVPGADSIDVVNDLNGTPTTASTQSIFDLLRSPAYRLLDDQLVERDPTQVYSVVSPADTEVIPAAPWGGTSLPAWYVDDPEIRNVKASTGWMARGLVPTVVEISKSVLEQSKGKDEAEVLKRPPTARCPRLRRRPQRLPVRLPPRGPLHMTRARACSSASRSCSPIAGQCRRCWRNQSRAGRMDASNPSTYASKWPPGSMTSFFGSRACAKAPRASSVGVRTSSWATSMSSGVGAILAM
jgi:hypothetical protein